VQPVDWGCALEEAPTARRPAPLEAASPGSEPKINSQSHLAEAQRQWEEKAREQYQAGYREGMATGKQGAAAAVQPVLDNLAKSLHDLAGFRERLRHDAEADLVRLALAIARRILRREIGVDAEALTALVRHAIERVNARDVARIRTHPEHAPAIRQYLAARQQTAMTVEPDASLPPGSVLFDTAMGTLDASVDTQLAEIENGLVDRLGGRA
jgi:flagellar assembly protein FliH